MTENLNTFECKSGCCLILPSDLSSKMLQEVGMLCVCVYCIDGLMCVAVPCVSMSWGWGWLNEQLLAPAATATISLVSLILPHAFSALASVAPTFTVITVRFEV